MDLVFDFDGVIGDTRALLLDAFRTFDASVTDEDFRVHFDGNVHETPRVRFTPEGVATLHETYCRGFGPDI